MGYTPLVQRFERWLMASTRGDGTIKLRVRHARDLARRADPLLMTVDDIEDIMARRRHLSPETRKSQLASWRVFFGWMHKRGLRADDPTTDIESIRVPVKVPRVAPDDAIMRALEGSSSRDRALVLLARYGCLRLTELTTLHMHDRQGERLTIRGKGDKERVVYANEHLLHALHVLELEQGEGFYFPGDAGPHLHSVSVNKIITRVTGWNPHSLRHAGATAAYNATGDLRGVMEMLGHSSLATTQRYLHLDDSARRRVAAGTIIIPEAIAA